MAASRVADVHEAVINSMLLGENREIMVYLPADYHKSKLNYPVLYLTDGDHHGPHTSGTIDYLSKYGQIPSMIVVGILNPSNTRTHNLTVTPEEKQSHNQLQNADRFLYFIESEVMPFVKQNYRTLDFQILSGTSHGGQFAINAMLKKPYLFDGIIAISPSLYWDNQQIIKLAEQALKNNMLKGRLYISIANEQQIMTAPFNKLVDLLKQYPSGNLQVSWQTFMNETHNTTVLQGQYAGLKHVFSEWAIPEGEPKTLEELKVKFELRSKLLKTQIKIPEDIASAYAGWLQYLNKQTDSLILREWNRKNYPQSLEVHTDLIKAYLHFKLNNKAETALKDAFKTLNELDSEQQAKLKALFI